MSMKKMLAVVAAASLMAAPAFAANPFSDVPMNHWAYDAVEQLSAKGILEGYPNGTFKGNRAMTRYEIATMVARMMANGGVGGADAEKLKALIVEFAPELEALGVKVDGFDGRLSKLEKGLGGWKITGQIRFDVFSHDDAPEDKSGWSGRGSQFNRGRLFLHRDLAEKVSFDARWHGGQFDRFWITAKDFMGVEGLTTKVGQFYLDFEGRDNLYKTTNWTDDDAFFYDGTIRGLDVNYSRGALEVEAFYNTGAGNVYAANGGQEDFGARIAYNGPKFHASVNAFFYNGNLANPNYKVYYAALGFKPMKGINLSGAYWMEKDIADDPKAWAIILDVDQSLLKFTSLRAEYKNMDEGFYIQNGSGPMCWHTNMTYNKVSGSLADETKFFKVEAMQKWGAKFQTYERYAQAKADGEKAKELQLGIGYQYTPNLWFGVDYTKCDGQFASGAIVPDAEDKVIRFRSILNF